MPGLTSMQNIGKEMERKLVSVGIDSPEALVRTGAREAFFMLKTVYPRVCLVHLYVLEGAIQGVPFNSLPAEKKRELKEFSDCLK